MKQLLPFNPIFTPGAAGAGTLDFSLLPGFNIDKLYAVIDVTQNTPLYIPGAPGLGVTVTSNASGQNSGATGTVLLLQTNTSFCATSDRLSIFYDTQAGYENNTVAERNGQMQILQENTAQILMELRVMNYILAQGLNINIDDIDGLRNDLTNMTNNSSSTI